MSFPASAWTKLKLNSNNLANYLKKMESKLQSNIEKMQELALTNKALSKQWTGFVKIYFRALRVFNQYFDVS